MAADAESGVIPLTFDFNYEDKEGTGISGQETANLSVAYPIKMELDAAEIPPFVYASETQELCVKALNLSRTGVYNVRISLSGTGLFPMEDIFIGNMEAGTERPGTMRIYVGTRTMTEIGTDVGKSDEEKYGEVKGTITLKYEDAKGKTYEIERDFRTEIKKAQILSLTVNEEAETNSWQISVFVIIIVGHEEFLEEAGQIPGIRSVTPVIEIPAKIRAEGYTMEISLQGVDLTELIMTVKESNEVQVGNTPVLSLGENSIAMMEDVNGHKISEKKQKGLLDRYQEIDWQYCLVDIDKIESNDKLEDWESCLIAGILSSPADGIYLPYEQAENYAEKLSGQTPITRILVTVQGEKIIKK